MHDGRKKAASKRPEGTRTTASPAAAAGDRSSDRLLRLGRALGNDALQKRIEKGNATRDELMRFLQTRLETIRDVQLREIALSDDRAMRARWRDIADSHKTDVTPPDPTRWRDSARIYEEAAAALARGALDRGRQLVERAMREEQKQFDRLTGLVARQDVERDLDGPGALPPIDTKETCSASDVPADVRDLARAIQRVTETPDTLPVKRAVRAPWWTEEEDEEDDEEGTGAGA